MGWGITPNYVRKLYIGVALPKILYAAEVWYTPLQSRRNGRSKGGSVKVVRQLMRMQRAGALAITGGLCTSPTDTLDALTNLLPFHMIIEKWCYRAAARLASLPDKHPLQKPVKLSAKCLVKKHHSLLHNLSRLLDTDPESISKVTLAMHNPARTRRLPLRISVPPNKESSIKEAKEAVKEIQVFTDRLVIDNKVGAAALLTRQGKDHHILHYHLGNADKYNIYEAELVGLMLGMHLKKTEKVARCHMAIGTDNQAAISTVQKELSTPQHYLVAEIVHSLKLLN